MSTAEERIAALSPEQRELLLRRLRERGQAPAATAAPELPKIPAVSDRLAPVPLTDVQETFWLGRSGLFDLGGCGANVYIEYEFPGDVWPYAEDLNQGLRRMVDRHEILRTVIRPDGRQQVLAEAPPFEVLVEDLSTYSAERIEEHLNGVRDELRYARKPVDRWPLFEVILHQVRDSRVRLHARFDAVLIDGHGRNQFLGELARILSRPDAEPPPLPDITFLDVARALAEFRETATWRRSRAYWMERLPSLPPAPALPLARDLAPGSVPRIVKRQEEILPAEGWSELKRLAAQHGLSPTAAITAAFGDVLRLWCEAPSFTLGFGGSNRPPIHPHIRRLIGTFTVVHLLEVEDGETFLDRARRLNGRITEDLDHQSFSGLQVLREYNRLHRAGTRVTMPVQFNSVVEDALAMRRATDNPAPPAALDTAAGTEGQAAPVRRMPQIILNLTDEDLQITLPQVLFLAVALETPGGAFALVTQVVEELLPEGLVAEMLESYRALLGRLVAGEAAWSEARPARRSFPAGETPTPEPSPLLHELFAAQGPGELRRRALALAGRLQRLGLRPGEPVALVLERGPEQAVGILAALLSGAVCVPLDPSLPEERLKRRIEICGARVTLTRSDLTDWAAAEAEAPGEEMTLHPDAPACILFKEDPHPLTPSPIAGRGGREENGRGRPSPGDGRGDGGEGSRGGRTRIPDRGDDEKGAVLDHAALAAAVLGFSRSIGLDASDRLLALAPAGSDLALWEVLGTLAAGATLIVPAPEESRDPARLAALAARERITVWSSPPTLLEAVIAHAERNRKEAPGALRLAILHREPAPAGLPARLEALRPGLRVVTAWGAPEAPVAAAASGRLYVLDGSLAPRPAWAAGDLWAGGPGLARGYWRDDAATAEAFVVHPETGERLFRTGLRARLLPDGDVTVLGAPEEPLPAALGYGADLRRIENALQRHPEVRHAAVARPGGEDGRGLLVAWVLLRAGEEPADDDLRSHLRSTLPEHLVPDVFVRLDRFPLTADGRLDRAALPAPGAPGRPAGPESWDPLAAELAGLWEQVLGRRPEALTDDFFALGGDSLTAVRLLVRITERWGSGVTAEDLFARPTLEGLTGVLRRDTARRSPEILRRLGSWARRAGARISQLRPRPVAPAHDSGE
ncbi:MAG TPA: AMP-binding protein [Thermoanaerobaculia bacterium]